MKIKRHARKAAALAAVTLLGILIWTMGISAHCQIPCGIYDDPTRFKLLDEHIRTIEKSMRQIDQLSADAGKNANQLVRWVQNKEAHADELSRIVTQYFLQQRLKPAAPDDKAGWDAYVNKLVLCHRMLVAAMKAKQTTDLQYVRQLRDTLAEFRHAYLGAAEGKAAASAHKH